MQTIEYRKMYELEGDHWWFRGKRHLVEKLIQNYLPRIFSNQPKSEAVVILDVGCGTGKMLEGLSAIGRTIGCDFSDDAIAFCRTRGHRLLAQGSAESLPFAGESVNVVCLLDVIYHQGIQDDVQVLREVYRLLVPGGILVLTDSACPFLYGPHDRAVQARQRYGKKEILDKLTQAGFVVRRIGFFNAFLFPIAASVRLVDRYFRRESIQSSVALTPEPFNTVLFQILKLEAWIIRWFDFPIGLTVYAVAEKPVNANR